MDESPLFHVLLEGQRVGPYSRRTIVGMRIKKALSSEDVLEAENGVQLTVADLLGQPRASRNFNPNRSGSFSLVQAVYSVSLVSAQEGPVEIPAFKGEVQARVQGDVLRIAGRFRQGWSWKEDRIKIALVDVVHARIVGSRVDLWLRPDGSEESDPVRMQHFALDLFSTEAAGEFVEWLQFATPLSASTPTPLSAFRDDASAAKRSYIGWIAVIAVVAVVLFVLLLLVFRRAH